MLDREHLLRFVRTEPTIQPFCAKCPNHAGDAVSSACPPWLLTPLPCRALECTAPLGTRRHCTAPSPSAHTRRDAIAPSRRHRAADTPPPAFPTHERARSAVQKHAHESPTP